jgi:UDP-N-acetylmuramoyl-tripeptide--D-alanyl-D-alanine ligase
MINPLSLCTLQSRFGGSVINSDIEFVSLSTNTRDMSEGDLFVALKGERFDAHDFLSLAIANGACGLVVDRMVPESHLPQWVVEDTTLALGNIARMQREQFMGKLVAITGSSGKTTVKGMLLSILQAELGDTVFATQGNLNNHIGVPLSLLSLSKSHHYAVIEMGASALNEIAYLTHMASPHVALVNNVMSAHIEGFGSMDNIAIAKGEIYEGLSAEGVAIINRDDGYAEQWLLQNNHRKVIAFSISAESILSNSAEVCAKDIVLAKDGCAHFQLQLPGNLFTVNLHVLGLHNVANAIAAAACAYALEIEGNTIAQGLQRFVGVSGRLQRLSGVNGATIIDDSYNANPESVCAAIDVLAQVPANKVLVLGDMAELGEVSVQSHRDVGLYADRQKINCLLSVGDLTAAASKNFSGEKYHFTNMDELIVKAKKMADANTVFLIKGSRSSRMDRVVQALIQRGDNNASLAC